MSRPLPSFQQTRRCSATACLLAICLLLDNRSASSQSVVLESRQTVTGTVRAVGPGRLDITTASGEKLTCRIQEPDEDAVAINGAVVRFPATVVISGQVPLESIQVGVTVSLQANLHRSGRSRGTVSRLLVSDDAGDAGIRVGDESTVKGYHQCDVVGRVKSIRRNRLVLQTPPSDFVTKGQVTVELDREAVVDFRSDQYRKLTAGDRITKLVIARLNTGDSLVQELVAELAAQDRATVQDAAAKYSNLSDEPKSAPRSVRSAHFLLLTDISDRQARILLDRLEYMLKLVSQYYGRAPQGMIKCVVVRDINLFQAAALPPTAIAKIREPAGVTITKSLGNQRSATVYSCDKFGVVQHEAMHAYCAQTFGSTGPTWYAEGMAEMGNYWKEDQLAVDVDPVVITYLKRSEPKNLLDIVAAGQVTGDSWQAYAWRWALCHLLANNPNYARHFKGLGIALMTGQPGVSFESVYGSVAEEIAFEYRFFAEHVDNGYRVDLCAIDWEEVRSSQKLSGLKRAKRAIDAQRGWQSSGVEVLEGISYDIVATGEWKIAAAVTCDADGLSESQGYLEGAIFLNGAITEPFKIGSRHRFTATQDGVLLLRCHDEWTGLADNDGSLEVHVRRTPDP